MLMRVYRLTFDGRMWFVEACSFGEAVALWRLEVKEEWGADYEETDEPDECTLLGEGPVLRAK